MFSTPAHALGPGDVNLRLITGDDALKIQELTPDNNQCPAQGPVAAFVAYEITNTSGSSLSNVQMTMSGLNSGAGFDFASGQSPTVVVGAMGAGDSRVVAWFIEHPCAGNTPVTDGVTITATDSNPGSIIDNLTLEARKSLSANAGGVVTSIAYSPNPGAVGAELFLEVDHSFGNVQSGDQFILQPAGGTQASLNALTGFRADCYELVATQILSSTVNAIPAGTVNQMYFVAGASQNGTGFVATIRYVFIPLCGGVGTTFDPYAQETSGGANLKYTNGGTTSTVTPPEVSVLINKVASPDSFAFGVGGTVTYTVTLTNTALSDVRIAEIEDVLPAGFVFDSISGGSDVTAANSLSYPTNGDTGTITFVADGITTGDPYLIPGNGGTLTLIYTVTVPTSQPVGAYDNSVTATVGNETIGPATDTVTITPINVTISKGATPTSFIEGAGGTVTYTATITNSSGSSVSLTEFEDVLPAPLTFNAIVNASSDVDSGDLSAGPSNGDGGTLTFTLASPLVIAAGASIDFVYTATVPTNTAVGDYDNSITALVNGQSIGPSTARVSVTPLNATISKVVTPTSLVQGMGGPVTYTATITNNSAGAISLTQIDDVLPAPFTFGAIVNASSDVDTGDLSAGPSNGDSGALSFVLASPLNIAAGASIDFVYTANVPAGTAAGVYDNSITAITNGTEIGPAVARVTVTPLNASISKVVTPTSFVQGAGGEVTYTATITNSSAAAVSLTQIEDALPAPFTFGAIVNASSDIDTGDLSSGPSNGDSGTLTFVLTNPLNIAAGASVDFVYTATAPTNTAAGAYDNSITAVVNGSTIGPGVARVTITPLAISLQKTVNPTNFVQGDGGTATYTATITNNSAAAVSLTEIVDNLPAPFTFDAINNAASDIDSGDLSASPANGDGGTLTFTLTNPLNIAPAATVSFVYTVTVPTTAAVGVYDNSITAEVNNTIIGPATARVTITAEPVIDVSIAKVVTPTNFVEGAGGVVTYTATITNNSEGATDLTRIDDALPAPFTFGAIVNAASDIDDGDLSASPNPGDSGALAFILAAPLSIAPGASVDFVYTANVPVSAVAGTYDNSITAAVEGETIGPAVARVTITPLTVSISKSVNPNSFVQGAAGVATYTATITNSSAAAVSLTQIDDTLPAPFEFASINNALSDVDSGDLSAGPANGDTGALSFVLATPLSIAAGSSVDFVYSVTVPASAAAGNYDNLITAEVNNATIGPATARVTIVPLFVAITKTVNPTSMVEGSGGPVTYTSTITNNTTSAVSLTQIDDALPAPFTFGNIVNASSDIDSGDLSSGPANGATGALTFVLTTPLSIPASSSVTFVYTANVPATTDAGNYDNSITALVNGDTIGPAVARVTITPVVTSIQKFVTPSNFVKGSVDTVTYTVRFTNSSNSTVALTEVDDVLPAPFTFAAIDGSSAIGGGGAALSTAPSPGDKNLSFVLSAPLMIASNETVDLVFSVNVNGASAGTYDNSVTAIANDLEIGPATARVTITPLLVDIEKDGTPNSFIQGDGGEIIYTTTITNNSGSEVSLTAIEDTLPPLFEFVEIVDASSDIDSADLTGGGPASGATDTIVFTLTTPLVLAAGESVNLVYKINIPETIDPGPYDNSAVAIVNGEDIGPATDRVIISPKQADIGISKTALRSDVSVGDLVPYEIEVTSFEGAERTNIEIVDNLPPGFSYVPGTGSVDGEAKDPIVNGNEIVWGGLTIPANGTVVIDMLLSVGSSVTAGVHTNKAFVRQFDVRITEIAEASVIVTIDPTFDCAEVIGTVFPDLNDNGYQDDGEIGLPGVRIATVNGLLVTTDEFGRYHVACAAIPNPRRGSNYTMKVDERTLPQGYYVTTENPRVVRLTRGKMSKLNFGVTKKRVVEVKLDNSRMPNSTDAESLSATFDAETPSGDQDGAPKAINLGLSGSPDVIADGDASSGSSNTVSLNVDGETGDLSSEQLSALIELLKKEPSEIRITYAADPEQLDAAQSQAQAIAKQITNEWSALEDVAPLAIETRLGAAGEDAGAADGDASDVISMSFDGLKADPILNIDIDNDDPTIVSGETVDFLAYWNYGYWIDTAEVRIFTAEQADHEDPIAIVPIDSSWRTTWRPQSVPVGELQYVLRVYDSKGRYDETLPRALEFVSDAPAKNDQETSSRLLRGYGVDWTQTRNIPVEGGTITVFGKHLPEGAAVLIGGQPAPVSEDRTFVHEAIFPTGNHDIEVTVMADGRPAYQLRRTAFLPKDDWFYVAIGDLTVGKNFDADKMNIIADDDKYDETFVHGRAAMYLKGKIKGKYILTAAVDTGEEAVNVGGPSQLLRRLDPERFYPVYGDDSTARQDAPTRGKYYVRIERGDSRILWGNFVTEFVDTELAQMGRGLYGGHLKIVSPDATSFGERQYHVEGFAAEPGTIPAWEEFRGTGGSVFFLEHQDIAGGSDRLRIEIRDKDSGLVIETKDLSPGKDYDIDYIQGRVLLNRPLSSTILDDWLVRDGSLSGNELFLVVRYEYRPGIGSFDGLSAGGRASTWIGETLQLGITAQKEETGEADQQLFGADAKIRIADGTFIGGEVSRTRGPTFTNKSSVDGGFRFDPLLPPGDLEEAYAYRLESQFDSADFSFLGEDTRVASYFEHRDAGFAAPGRLTLRETDQWGVSVSTALPFGLDLAAEYDALEIEAGAERTAINVDVEQHFGENLSLGVGWRFTELKNPLVPTSTNQGQRNDGAIQLTYDDQEGVNAYAFAQGTLKNDDNRTRNDRVGVGGKLKLTNTLDVNGEVSTGNLGLGALAGVNYQRSDNSSYYLAYQLDTDRANTGTGTYTPFDLSGGNLTLGSKQRLSDTVSVYGEERFRLGEAASGVTHVYGVDFDIEDKWIFGATIENGTLEIADTGVQIDRTAATVTIGYSDDGASFVTTGEIRLDEEEGEDRSTYVSRSTLDLDVDDDWRFISRLNMLFSDSEKGAFYDGRFIEASAGFAYRPIANDKFNMLSKYTLFYDLPSPGQIAFDGSQANYKQRSHIFSIDGIYDLNEWLSVGAKYGMKIGQLTSSRISDDFYSSTAHLGVLRLDGHFVHNWDLLVEQHYLRVSTSEDDQWGMLLAVYRHVGNNAKIGVGYNFSKFSGDLTNLDYDDRGIFLNVIGKF